MRTAGTEEHAHFSQLVFLAAPADAKFTQASQPGFRWRLMGTCLYLVRTLGSNPYRWRQLIQSGYTFSHEAENYGIRFLLVDRGFVT
jgi:hypothetical protein